MLLTQQDTPLLSRVLSDLLLYATYACQPPEEVQLVHEGMASRMPIIPVDFVPFGLSSQALAVRVYRAWLREDGNEGGGRVPITLHTEFLKVRLCLCVSLGIFFAV